MCSLSSWRRRSARATLALIAAVSAVFFLAACGGGEDQDGEEVSNVIATAITSVEAEEKCVELVTAEFVTAIYGDEQACLEAEADSDPENQPDEVVVSQIEIDGDTASATVAEVGGDTDGATGTINLTRLDGQWQIAQLGIDYLRSILAQGLANADGDEEEMGPLADPAVSDCFGERMQELSDEEFRQIAYESMADREPNETFTSLLTGCLSEGSSESGEDVSLLRSQFEQGIRESGLADGASEQQIQCVISQLRRSVSDQEIIDQIGMGSEADPALARKAAVAISNC